MKKRIIAALMIVALVLATTISCNNPNKSPTDKVGGYHTSMVRVERNLG
ncbi:MAG: hypothetical protein J5891_06010 [Spirochaetales bacterium]|nr:hypothetical protein [Spirochaetales bacterium]